MKGWQIFEHSVRMVLRNLPQALRIGLVPSVIMAVIATVIFGSGAMVAESSTGELPTVTLGLSTIVAAIIWLVITMWIYVSWHRYILLEEYPTGWIPPFRMDRISSYFFKGFGIFLVMLACILVLGLSAAVLGPVSAVVVIPGTLAVAIAAYRWFPVLPAAAVGKPLSMTEAWEATRGSTGAIIVMVLLLAVMQLLLSLIVGIIVAIIPVVGIAVQTIFTLVLALINVSIMTTMYGHYIEGRPIG